jgi:hypothetical protein
VAAFLASDRASGMTGTMTNATSRLVLRHFADPDGSTWVLQERGPDEPAT